MAGEVVLGSEGAIQDHSSLELPGCLVVKDLMLSLQWPGFNLWPGHFHLPRVQPKKKKKITHLLEIRVGLAVAWVWSLAWELLPAMGMAKKKKKKKKKRSLTFFVNIYGGVPIMVQRKQIRLGTMRLRDQSLASFSGLRIWPCHELWYRLQTWLGSGVAVAVARASSCSSDST